MQLYYTNHPKLNEVRTNLNISIVKLPVTSRVNPPNMKCLHTVEKYAYSRGVTHSLPNTANMMDRPSMLRLEFRSFIGCYGGLFSTT